MELQHCIAIGNITLAKKLQKDENIEFIHFKTACAHNRLNILIWLCEINQPIQIDFDELLIIASINNNLKVIKWILKNKSINDLYHVLIKSLHDINIKVFQLIFTKLSITSDFEKQQIWNVICAKGDLKIIKWILRIRPDLYRNDSIILLICCNNLNIIKFLFKYDPSIITVNIDRVLSNIEGDDLQPMINWLIKVNPLIEI